MSNPRAWPIVESCDPAEKRGLHVIWLTVDPDDYWYLAHAAKIPHGPFSAMVAELKRERSFLPHEPNLAIMDCRGGAHTIDLETQETWFERFHKLGVHYVPSIPAAKELNYSIAELGEWLRPRYHPAVDRDVPKLRICDGVTRRMKENPFWALQSFLWDPTQTKPWHYRQKSKDFIDCMLMVATYPNLTYRRLVAGTAPTRSTPGSLAASYRGRTSLGGQRQYLGRPGRRGTTRRAWARLGGSM
jgi:hypothetical protein